MSALDRAHIKLAPVAADPIITELNTWLKENWDPDLTVEQWWDRLGSSGWAAPAWPTEWFGKGMSRNEAIGVARAVSAFGALGAPGGLGMQLAGPTIVTHGTDDQKRRFLPGIVKGTEGWCQLFSEPGAGSDLAGLQTRAERDGDEWIVTGQKVWTSTGHYADLGMLLARTNPDVPKHKGISYFGIAMSQPGIEVRPLREMTGRALFNEVFLTEARVHDDARIGGVNDGWAVANTTLANERSGLGAGGSGGAAAALPGTKAGHLRRRAGDFVNPKGSARASAGGGAGIAGLYPLLVDTARNNGKIADATIRQDLMHLYTLNEIARFTSARVAGSRAAGKTPGLDGSTAKLAMSRIVRSVRDLGPRIVGPAATLHSYADGPAKVALAEAAHLSALPIVTEAVLFAPAPTIYGGSDEIQRNIIGERVLGLPKEPSNDRDLSFKDLPKNAVR